MPHDKSTTPNDNTPTPDPQKAGDSLSLDPDLLLRSARAYHRRGWRPFPLRITFDEDGRKVPHFPKAFDWTELRDRAFTWEETVALFARIEDANALAIVLEPGHIVVETDTPKAAEMVAGCVLPDGPRARSQAGGLHLHFRASEALTEKTIRPGDGLEFLCRQIVFMPPSLGRYQWEALPAGDLPELPSGLAAILRLALNGGKLEPTRPAVREATARGKGPEEAVQVEEGKWGEWEELLGETKADGPDRRKALCPLHVETRASFAVYRGKRSGHLQGECFGCGWRGSLRQLRRALRAGDSTLYRMALSTVASFGDSIDAQMRQALLAIVGLTQQRGLDPREPFALSYREIAKLTGCEPLLPGGPKRHGGLPAGLLPHGGKQVRRLLAKLTAKGLKVQIGTGDVAGKAGRCTTLQLPAAWFAASGLVRSSVTLSCSVVPAPLRPDTAKAGGTADTVEPSSTVDKQAKRAESGPRAIPGDPDGLSPAWRETLATLSPRRPPNECNKDGDTLLSGADKRRRAARWRKEACRRSGAMQGPRRYVSDAEMWGARGEWE